MRRWLVVTFCVVLSCGCYAVGRYQGFHAGIYVGVALGTDMFYRQARCIDWGGGCVDQKSVAKANQQEDESFRWWKLNGGARIEP